MVPQLILTFEAFLAKLTEKLTLSLIFFFLFKGFTFSCSLVLPFEVFLHFFESLFLKLLLDCFHLFFLLFFLLLSFYFLLCLLLFLFLQLDLELPESRVSFLDVSDQIFYGFNVGFLLPLPLLFVFFLHFSSHPSIVGLSCVPFFAPDKSLVSCKVVPILIKFKHFIFNRI